MLLQCLCCSASCMQLFWLVTSTSITCFGDPAVVAGNACNVEKANIQVLMAAEKAVQLPAPVRKEQKLIRPTPITCGPLLYAVCIGKYPHANATAPTRTANLVPLLSIR